MGDRLDAVRARLGPVFRRGLDSKIGALSRALAEHRRGDPAAAASIRRFAHQLRGSAASYGFPAVSVAGAAVEDSSSEHLEVSLHALLRLLHGIKREGASDPVLVLLVDDDEELCAYLADVLRSIDRVVLWTSELERARSYLRTLRFDCVVLDLGLGGVDGRDLLADLSAPPLGARAPVIVLSALAEEAARDECLALGAARYLTKPVDAVALRSAVESVVERTTRLVTESEAIPPPWPRSALDPARILVADDDESILHALALTLEEEGYDLVHARDGREALERARAERFALVILDGQMEPMDGFDALRRLRQWREYDDVPILMLTGLGGDADIERAFGLGADDYLEKPCRPRELRARLRRHLQRAARRRCST